MTSTIQKRTVLASVERTEYMSVREGGGFFTELQRGGWWIGQVGHIRTVERADAIIDLLVSVRDEIEAGNSAGQKFDQYDGSQGYSL